MNSFLVLGLTAFFTLFLNQVQLIKVTIKLEWDAARVGKPIPTDATHTTKVRDGTVLLDILNEAADAKKRSPFNKYESTYHGGMGYFITAFNGIKSVRLYS